MVFLKNTKVKLQIQTNKKREWGGVNTSPFSFHSIKFLTIA